MVKLNENIRILRKRLSLTQDQFAQQLGVKRSLVGAYEEGRAEPRLELLQKMAEVFSISKNIGGIAQFPLKRLLITITFSIKQLDLEEMF